MSLIDTVSDAVSSWKWSLLAGAALVTVTTAGLWILNYGHDKYQSGIDAANAAVAKRDVLQARVAVAESNKNAGITADRQERKDAADTTREHNRQAADAADSATRTELGRLRNDLAATRAALDGAVSSSSCAPYRQAIAARDAVLEAMGAAGAGLARTAQGHADDSLMFENAWPKK